LEGLYELKRLCGSCSFCRLQRFSQICGLNRL
jgi:hypothetical protein